MENFTPKELQQICYGLMMLLTKPQPDFRKETIKNALSKATNKINNYENE